MLITEKSEKLISGCDPHSTNNRMEMTAAIKAFKLLKESTQVEIYTDSQYLMKGLIEWLPKWILKNWRCSTGIVANRDLWEELVEATKPHKIHWNWVKGHAGDEYNQRVNMAAVKARRK